MNKYYLTYNEAIALLPDEEYIHTFLSDGKLLIGADWSKEEILNKLNEPNVIVELAGEGAKSMKHGIGVYSENSKRQCDVLFIETDEKKLSSFENTLKEQFQEVKTDKTIALAEEIAKAYRECAQIHMEETKAYIKQHRTYNSKSDYDKAHTKTIAQMVAEHLISIGYHRDNAGVPAPLFSRSRVPVVRDDALGVPLCDPPDTL